MKNTIQKIILFAAVLFSAGFTVSAANAQQQVVFGPPPPEGDHIVGTQWVPEGQSALIYEFTDSIQEHYRRNSGAISWTTWMRFLAINNAPVTITNNLPVFQISATEMREIQPGDNLILYDQLEQSHNLTLIVYIRADNEYGLAMSLSVAINPMPLSPPNIFLNSLTFRSTSQPAATNIRPVNIILPDCTGGATLNGNVCECATDALPILQDDGGNSFSCRAPNSATECPDEFFNNAVSPARCDPIPTCDTTTELNTGTNMCDCRTGFSGRVSPTMCERNAADCTGATPVLFNGICVAACESDEARNAAGNCVPNPANCEANAITNPDDDMNCICIDDMHQFVAGSTTECEPIPATCGANAINDPNDNTMCVCVDEMHRFVEGSTTMCEPNSQDNMEETEMGNEMETEMEESQNPQPQPQNIGSGRPKEFAYIGAGVFIIGFAASYIAGGDFPIFTYSPDFGYSLTESGYSANVGGRADFRKDNWHLYYFANQTNANGEFDDFRYTSGGRYNGDLFAAAFSESVAGETANYNFSLSADVDGRLVDFSPVYRLHSEYDKGEFSTRNELNLQGNFRYDGWTIRPSAGFRWENANDFSENARFQINAIHRF